MSSSFHSHDGEYEQDIEGHDHEHDATSRINHGPSISNIIPNPLTDTTTAVSEGPRPGIHSDSNAGHGDKRPEDSWNSNTLTLNESSQTKEKSFKRMSTSTHAALARQEGLDHDWEEIWEKERQVKWLEKVQEDLKGWRGGFGLVHFSLSSSSLLSSFSLSVLSF
jgi:hypothetical protein